MLRSTTHTGRALWRHRVAATPDRTFLLWGERSWTFGEFDDRVRRLAAGLAGLGVEQGAPVLVGMGNRPETFQVELALAQLGALFVPLLPGLTFEELAYPIHHSEGRHLIADDTAATVVLPRRDELTAVEHVIVTGDVAVPSGVEVHRLEDVAAGDRAEPRALPGYDEDTPAAILYTSGSTGRPKGVLLRAGCFHSVGKAFADRFGVTADDTYILPTAVAHAVGSLTALSMVVTRGCRLSLVDRFSPGRFWDDVAAHEATFSILFPAHLNLLLEADDGTPPAGGHTLRLVITHAHNRRFAERFGVELATVWGMTETGALCVGSEPGYTGELGDNYVGTPMEGVEVGVFDDRFGPVAPGGTGEIALRHRHVMLGYLKDPEATAQTLVDGWVRSGDQGVLDDDGRLFFVGRIKNMIKRSGENISAEEVEEALMEHPDVAECTVFGVPDPIRTEEVAAVIVRRSGAAADPVAVREASARRLVRWKLPRYVAVRDEPLPRLANGKLDRVSLRAWLDLDAAWDAQAVTGSRPGTS